MENILVPVDFSDYAENALYLAAIIAKQKNANLHLVHTLGIGDSVLPHSDSAFDAAPYVILTERKFDNFIDKPFLKDISVSYSVRKDSVFKEIQSVIKEVNADLIVMGSHGSSGFEEFFIGSNTQKVVRNSDVPVIVVKEKMEGFEINDAVFACDFKTENVKAYQNAVDFFELLEININLVYINTPNHFKSSPEIQKLVSNFFDAVPSEYKKPTEAVNIYNDYNVEKGVMDFCKEISADFIGIPTHGRKGLSHVFMGSIGEDIVNHSPLPVITFKI